MPSEECIYKDLTFSSSYGDNKSGQILKNLGVIIESNLLMTFCSIL